MIKPPVLSEGFILRETRFELATFWSVARRSIQLSYLRVKIVNNPFLYSANRMIPDYTPYVKPKKAIETIIAFYNLQQKISVNAGRNPDFIPTLRELE